MGSLHLVFSAPTAGSALADCLRAATDGDTVLLLQDGVLAGVATTPVSAALLREAAANGVAFVALNADVDARGIASLLHAGIRQVDDDGFVALTERFARTLSWF